MPLEYLQFLFTLYSHLSLEMYSILATKYTKVIQSSTEKRCKFLSGFLLAPKKEKVLNVRTIVRTNMTRLHDDQRSLLFRPFYLSIFFFVAFSLSIMDCVALLKQGDNALDSVHLSVSIFFFEQDLIFTIPPVQVMVDQLFKKVHSVPKKICTQ